MLDENEFSAVRVALGRWAEAAPNEPVLGFIEGSEFMTPSQLLNAVAAGDEDGQAFLEMIEHAVRRDGVESVVARFERAAAMGGENA